ncbi:MAG: hypothetical protein ACLSHR_11645 [Oscillospiraceae bacterium]
MDARRFADVPGQFAAGLPPAPTFRSARRFGADGDDYLQKNHPQSMAAVLCVIRLALNHKNLSARLPERILCAGVRFSNGTDSP